MAPCPAPPSPSSNPVLLLALDLSRRLAGGELTYPALEQLTQYLTADGFLDRATRLHRYLGETDAAANEARLRTLFRRLTEPDTAKASGPVPFEDFKDRVEAELFGLVITAHPTFSLSGDLEDFGEPADYRSDDSQSYHYENEQLFKPMRGLYRLVQRSSTAVAHRIGFFG